MARDEDEVCGLSNAYMMKQVRCRVGTGSEAGGPAGPIDT